MGKGKMNQAAVAGDNYKLNFPGINLQNDSFNHKYRNEKSSTKNRLKIKCTIIIYQQMNCDQN